MKSRERCFGRRRVAPVLLAAFVVLTGLAGCAGQQATITPKVIVESEQLGHGVEVSTTVRDARPEPVIGRCNPNSSMSGKLTIACDPAPAIRSAVEKGLREKGFSPAVARESVVRSLTVELTQLTYSGTQEGDRLVAKGVAVLSVKADNNGTTMERKYTGETVWKLSGDNIEPEFDKLLSQSVSKALTTMTADYELIHFLEKTILRTRDIK